MLSWPDPPTKNFELRETQSPYNAVFDAEKNDIDGESLWFWNT